MRDIRPTEVRKVGRPEPNPDRVGDVVFVHGLNEDPHGTWSNGSEDGFWPGWLAEDEDCPNLDVWYVGYQVAARGGQGAAMPLVFRADNVLAALKSRGLGTKPLCFITHSMGGLLVKQMLRRAESYEEFKSFSEVTRGVVFFSTPHTGSGLANLAQYFRFLRFSVAVQELRNYETPLVDLSEWYSGSVNRLHIKTQVFYENVPTRKGFADFIVVTRASADPGIPGIPLIGVDADHNDICRLPSKDNYIYIRIKKFVLEVLTLPPRTRRSTRSMSQQRMSDRQIFQAWRIAFDSSVFKGPWRLQSDLFRAKQGIEDIINAVNTGDIRGSTVKGKGRIFLKNKEWLFKMENVASRLDRIRFLVNKLEELRTHAPIGWAAATLIQEGKWDPNAPNEISDKIDHERDEIIETMNEIWKALEIPTLIKPSEVKTS